MKINIFIISIFFQFICIAFGEEKQRKMLLGRRRDKGLTISPPPDIRRDRSSVKTMWFKQQLDHFNSAETRSWMQKYFVSKLKTRFCHSVFATFFLRSNAMWSLNKKTTVPQSTQIISPKLVLFYSTKTKTSTVLKLSFQLITFRKFPLFSNNYFLR